MEQQNLTYESAFNELKDIAHEIETANVSVDVLAEKVKRAAYLSKHCQTKLRSAETEVNNIITQLETGADKAK